MYAAIVVILVLWFRLVGLICSYIFFLLFAAYAQLLALGTLVSSQRVTYDFKYYQSDVPTDIPVLILSVGKSMFVRRFFFPSLISCRFILTCCPL
jgi:hypothetical protein